MVRPLRCFWGDGALRRASYFTSSPPPVTLLSSSSDTSTPTLRRPRALLDYWNVSNAFYRPEITNRGGWSTPLGNARLHCPSPATESDNGFIWVADHARRGEDWNELQLVPRLLDDLLDLRWRANPPVALRRQGGRSAAVEG